jgi:hypothetical protein
MSNQIPGVPEGWELVHCLRIGEPGETGLSQLGDPFAIGPNRTIKKVPIVRKIEKPARYRPFASAEEYLPHWGKPICTKGGSGFDSVVSTSMIGIYVAATAKIYYHSMSEAFEQFTFADGTPFGVKIDE